MSMPMWFNACGRWTASAFFSPLAKTDFQMKNVHMHAGSILFAAAISVGSLAFVATGFGADAPPTDAAKAVQNAVDKSVDSANDAKAAADGWTPVGPLPTLPALPKGAELQPDEQVCRIVYQWDYYCRKQGK